MNNRRSSIIFQSILGPLIENFIQEKQACGYKYTTETDSLWRLDRFLCQEELRSLELPRALVQRWIEKDPNEAPGTQRERIGLLRRFGIFLIHQGYPAYLPDIRSTPKREFFFVPHIFSHEEIRRIFSAADALAPNPRSPLRHLLLPEIFRVLYSCGLRLGEVIRLKVENVDLASGILTINQGKFHKDRLVPMAPSLVVRLQLYANFLGHRCKDSIFFPAPHDGSYHRNTIYRAFRQLLWKARISHGGRSQGPRLHDLRHTFAVHRLEKWCREGADLNAKLPVLSKYMGHQSVSSTQHYLRLTAEIFSDLTARTSAQYGNLIPRRRTL